MRIQYNKTSLAQTSLKALDPSIGPTTTGLDFSDCCSQTPAST